MPRVAKAAARPPQRPRLASNGYRLPDPLPPGEVLTDSIKTSWTLGESIGLGGFGEIYVAKSASSRSSDYDYVVKVDHHNGPLFNEMHFYHRVCKADQIQEWKAKKGLSFLGMPEFMGSGIHDKPSNVIEEKKKTKKPKEMLKYRFLVMPRFGTDLQKMLNEHKKFSTKVTYTIAIKIIDILEYIHSFGYIHGDIKASNLLLSRQEELGKKPRSKQGVFSEIYLVDFGLVERFIFKEDNVHKKYEEDARRANNGTVEFTSRDGHIGAFSRRSDLEVLAYNLLSWLSGGKLPWMPYLKDLREVKNLKDNFMTNINALLEHCFKKEESTLKVLGKSQSASNARIPSRNRSSLDVPPGIREFIEAVVKMGFEEKPDYDDLKRLLQKGIIDSGEKYDGKFSFTQEAPKSSNGLSKRPSSESNGTPPRTRKRVI
ncbi:serine/threonine-protein kinase VRK1-like [Brevipalpus obovatus]|uniref:serine/threonine-protein kinase VRK1-like n=1 Tax=Brevipalpus obovatus TaxID=246614 RepID=UPI003D9DE903